MKSILILLLLTASSKAIASDMSALWYLLGAQVVLFFWPIILPIFFIKHEPNKLKAYLIKMVAVYGMLGVALMPNFFYNLFGIWFGVGSSLDYDFAAAAKTNLIIVYSINFIVLILSLFVLKRFTINLTSKVKGSDEK
jgi:hypothetical protein